jgi:hypothetical protein
VNLLPDGTSFASLCLVDNVIIPLGSRHAQQPDDMADGKLGLRFDNSKCHTARHVPEHMASRRCVRVLHSPESPAFPIADFYLFERSKWQVSGSTLRSEQNVLETVSEILNEFPKEEVKIAFCIE